MTSKLEFESDGNGEEYEFEAICDNAVYARESEGYLPGFYYLVLWKSYLEEENTWELASVVLHFHKLINTFYCDHPEKPTTTSPPIDSAQSMTRPTVKPKAEASSTKWKRGQLANGTSKHAKKNWTSSFLSRF